MKITIWTSARSGTNAKLRMDATEYVVSGLPEHHRAVISYQPYHGWYTIFSTGDENTKSRVLYDTPEPALADLVRSVADPGPAPNHWDQPTPPDGRRLS